MKRFTAILFSIALLAVPASSQSSTQQTGDAKCTAKYAQSLSIRGIHLGMSVDELLAMFPDVVNKESITQSLKAAQDYPNFGRAIIYLQPSGPISREKLAGISNISLTLFDNRVVAYSVGYEGLPRGAYWANLDEWVAKLSEKLNLPHPSQWIRSGNSKTLNCDGIIVTAYNTGDGGSFSMHTEDFTKLLEERNRAYLEQKRREFKP
jgi:hypothetical protein